MSTFAMRNDVKPVAHEELLSGEVARSMLSDWFEDRGGSALPSAPPWRPEAGTRLPPNVTLLQVEPGQTYRFIAAGDGVSNLLGGAPVGHWLDSFPGGRAGDGLCLAVVGSFHMSLPHLVRVNARIRGSQRRIEAMVLPYGEDAASPSYVAMLLGMGGPNRDRLEDASEALIFALGEQVMSRIRHRRVQPKAPTASSDLGAAPRTAAPGTAPAASATTPAPTTVSRVPARPEPPAAPVKPKESGAERRVDGRFEVRERATLRIAGVESPCVIRDISTSGAALEVMSPDALKGREGTLISDTFGFLRFTVRWRSLNRLGIEFTASMTQTRVLRDALRKLGEGR